MIYLGNQITLTKDGKSVEAFVMGFRFATYYEDGWHFCYFNLKTKEME